MIRIVAFEGIDGAGKSSLSKAVENILTLKGVPNIRAGELRSKLSVMVRQALHDHASPLEKTLLFAADRALTLSTCEGLDPGTLVLWDRYVDSALVYREVELEVDSTSTIDLEYVRRVNSPFPSAFRTVLLDLPVDVALERVRSRNTAEVYGGAFLERARELYRSRAQEGSYIVVDAEQEREVVARQVSDSIIRILGAE